MSSFIEYIGVNYSGAAGPDSRCKGLRVYCATAGEEAVEVFQDAGQNWHWTRPGVAQWLANKCRNSGPLLIGIDHAFSFPASYMARRKVETWDAFLDDFCAHWPTDKKAVDECRPGEPCAGTPAEFRLTERWTSSAKSVFLFDVQGSVAKSTHAGLPWVRWLRRELGGSVHFWPFDGWRPPEEKTVIAEVYPSIFRNRFPKNGRTGDQQDAFAVAEWMRTRDSLGHLRSYFTPFHSDDERRVAALEGWILGVA